MTRRPLSAILARLDWRSLLPLLLVASGGRQMLFNTQCEAADT